MLKTIMQALCSLSLCIALQAQAAGTPAIQGKIVNGQDTDPLTHPFYVYVYSNNGTCGGSLIDARYVMTAAHCLQSGSGKKADVDSIKVAILPIAEIVENKQLLIPTVNHRPFVTASDYVVHPQYQRYPEILNDIAIIELKTPVNDVMPIALNVMPKSDLNGEVATVVGLGAIGSEWNEEKKRYESVHADELLLQQTQLRIRGAKVCREVYQDSNEDNRSLCMSALPENPGGICSGDSGGPAYIMRNGRAVQVGIVSYSAVNCNRTDLPQAFADVAYYQDFIKSVVPYATFYDKKGNVSSEVRDVAGAWFDPSQDGFGVTLSTSGMLALIYYGYDLNGKAFWLVADPIDYQGHLEINKPYKLTLRKPIANNGARFDRAPTNPPGITQWGSVTLTILGCKQIKAEFKGSDGNITLNLVPLLQSASVACEG